MDYLSPMEVRGTAEFTHKIRDRILRVSNRDMNGDGSMAEVEWEGLSNRNLWLLTGQQDRSYGVLELERE